MKKLKGRRIGVRGYAVGDKDGIFILNYEITHNEIEIYAIFRLKADAEAFRCEFKNWGTEVKIKPIYSLPL